MEWNGMKWTGPDRTVLDDRTGLEWTGLDRTGPDRTGPDRNRLDWTGLDWTGPDRTGPDWIGLETTILNSRIFFQALLQYVSCMQYCNPTLVSPRHTKRVQSRCASAHKYRINPAVNTPISVLWFFDLLVREKSCMVPYIDGIAVQSTPPLQQLLIQQIEPSRMFRVSKAFRPL
jgi:hypothetical protein